MSKGPLTLTVDGAAVAATVEEIAQLLKSSPEWLQWLAAQAFEQFQHSSDLVRIDGKCVPTGLAGQFRIGAQPGQKLLLLLAALRAGNGQAGSWVAGEFHGGTCAK